MPTRNVVLTDQQEDIIEDLVASGQYQNASEVLREGLRLLARREAHEKEKLEALREAARLGFGALDRGEYKEFDDVDELEDYLNKVTDQVISKSAKRRR
jgi:antitoxin ParD1/3/4